MISFALALFLFLPPIAAAPKPAQTQFDVNAYVVLSKAAPAAPHEEHQLYALIDGQCVELQGNAVAMLDPGEYKARLIWGPLFSKLPNRYDIVRTYEFLLPDGSTRRFDLTGLGAGDSHCATNP